MNKCVCRDTRLFFEKRWCDCYFVRSHVLLYDFSFSQFFVGFRLVSNSDHFQDFAHRLGVVSLTRKKNSMTYFSVQVLRLLMNNVTLPPQAFDPRIPLLGLAVFGYSIMQLKIAWV